MDGGVVDLHVENIQPEASNVSHRCPGRFFVRFSSPFLWPAACNIGANVGRVSLVYCLWSDTLQAGACVYPPFQKSLDHYMLTHVAYLQFLPSDQYGLCFGYCFFFSRFPQRTGHFLGAISRSPKSFRLHSKSARTILASKLSVTSTTLNIIPSPHRGSFSLL